jgi:hypothetical protein
MTAEHEIAAPARLARMDVVSPWQPPLQVGAVSRWLTVMGEAWRDAMELYARAGLHRGHRGWF